MTSEINNYIVTAGSGQKDIFVKAIDVAGNESNVYKASIFLKDDIEAPKVELIINNGDELTTSNEVVLTINSFDDLTPINKLTMRLSNNGVNRTSWEPLQFIKNWNIGTEQGLKRVFMVV
jgi:hypothetical protein